METKRCKAPYIAAESVLCESRRGLPKEVRVAPDFSVLRRSMTSVAADMAPAQMPITVIPIPLSMIPSVPNRERCSKSMLQ